MSIYRIKINKNQEKHINSVIYKDKSYKKVSRETKVEKASGVVNVSRETKVLILSKAMNN